jgi:uncharacterized protein (TIGR02271 family)
VFEKGRIMLDNQGYQNIPADQQILEGTPVYDVNGDKVGEVSDRGLQRNALIVHKGLIFPKELYVPLSAIRGRNADGIFLNVAKGDINSQNWDQPPTDTVDTTNRMTNTSGAVAGATTAGTTANDVHIPLREEELVADKQRQQIGNVHARREVTEEQETIQAPVTHEEVYVERRPGSNLPVGDDAFTDKDIDVPVMGEQLNVSKESRVAEDVHLRKNRVTEQQRASDTVRRERLNIDGQPEDVMQTRDATDNVDDMDTRDVNNP